MTHPDAYERFQKSKVMDSERWREGEGYDMDAFAAMTPDQRDAEAEAVIANPDPDWRDIQILATHDGKRCVDHLRDLLLHPSINTRAYALGALIRNDHTPGSVADVQLAHIIGAIDNDGHEGMTHTLLLAHHHAGPMSKLALLRGTLNKPALSLHFAATLIDLAGLSSDDTAAFDPKFRPLLLRLLPDNAPADREAAFAEVCRHLEIDPATIPAEGDGGRAWAEMTWPRG